MTPLKSQKASQSQRMVKGICHAHNHKVEIIKKKGKQCSRKIGNF